MKKSLLAIALALASTAVVASTVTVVPKDMKQSRITASWVSANKNDVVHVLNPTKAQLEVNITVDSSSQMVPVDGINVNCNGAITHVNAGSGLACITQQDVSWVDDGSGTNGSAGTYEFHVLVK